MYNEASLDNLIIKLMAHQFYKTQYTTTSNIATTQDILAVIVIPVNLEWSHIPHSNKKKKVFERKVSLEVLTEEACLL